MAMQNLIDRFSLRGKRFTVLTDDAFRDLGEDLCAAVSGGVRRDLSALALADSSWGYILLICTPQSYLACQLYRLLDFLIYLLVNKVLLKFHSIKIHLELYLRSFEHLAYQPKSYYHMEV